MELADNWDDGGADSSQKRSDDSQIAGSGEIVENVESSEKNSANSTNSPHPQPHAVFPEDSILEDYMNYARNLTESEDQIIIGTYLPIVAAVLGRNVDLDFAGKKFPNLYTVIVTKPGLRKSTTIRLAKNIGRSVLDDGSFLDGVASDEALFDLYLANPDRILIEDEGNAILSNWASHGAGKLACKRFLKLYDCELWAQNYMRQKKDDNGSITQTIPANSTSLLIGTTLNNCRFNQLEVRDGMRRRVNYYVSEHLARTIDWPSRPVEAEFQSICTSLRKIRGLKGEMKLSDDAKITWSRIQKDNRKQIDSTTGSDPAADAHLSALAEVPSKILKMAMIFEACRWAKNPDSRDWRTIQADTLELAAQHVAYCLSAAGQLDLIAERAEIENDADCILAKIRSSARALNRGSGENVEFVELTKTQLTSDFAHHSGRRGAMTTDRLYNKVIPNLIARGLAKAGERSGKRQTFLFSLDLLGQ